MSIILQPWDSNFFGFKIGKIQPTLSNYLAEILYQAKEQGYELIYAFTEKSFKIPATILHDFGGRLVDQKIIFQKPTHLQNSESNNIKPYKGIEITEKLYELAIQSGHYSRFFLDDNFPKGSFHAMYRQWIENALIHSHQIILTHITNQEISGMATVESSVNGIATIGLIAVDTLLRGQDIGSQLLNASLGWAFEHQQHTLLVATQLANKQACAFYQKNGFKVQNTNNIYHFWLQ